MINIKQEKTFSFTSAEFLNNPYPFYDRMRSIDPVYEVKSIRYPGWYITGFEEAKKILLDNRFKNRIPLPAASKRYEGLTQMQSRMMLYQNEVDHRRLRGAVGKFFIPREMEQLRPFISKTAQDLLNQAEEKGTLEVMSEFAFPLASSVIGKILGIPSQEMNQFRHWSAQLIQAIDFTRTKQSLIHANKTIFALQDFLKNLISERKQSPKNDLISALVEEAGVESKLTEVELLATLILLVIAGHETTVNLIGNSVLALVDNPDQADMLIKTPELIEQAVEEFLRYESPTQMTARIASTDVQINGATIKEGEHVYIFLGAANRDPEKFVDPNKLDIIRNPNPHLSFGHGSHFCLGASLAKNEAQIAILELVERTSYLELAGPPEWRKLVGFRSLQRLPLLIGN